MFVLFVSFVAKPRLPVSRIKKRLKVAQNSDGMILTDGGSLATGDRSGSANVRSVDAPLRITNLRSMWINQQTAQAVVYAPQRKMFIESIEDELVADFKTAVGLLKGKNTKLLNATRYDCFDIIFEEDQKAKIVNAGGSRALDQLDEVCIAGSLKKTFFANSKSNNGRSVEIVGDLLLFLSHRASTLLTASLKDLDRRFQSQQDVPTVRVQEDVADFSVDSNRVVTVTEIGLITIYRFEGDSLKRVGRVATTIQSHPFPVIATSIGCSAGQTLVSCFSENKRREVFFHLNHHKPVCSRELNEGRRSSL